MVDSGRHTGADDPTEIQNPVGTGLDGLTLCGRYELSHLIGSGGMAQVWEATDLVLGRQVAVKVLHPHLAGDGTFIARFRAEAIAAARLNHPNIVGVFDTCSDLGHEAIVMELLHATTLRHYLDEHRTLDVPTTTRIALRVLDALESAHGAGLIHRDVKPSNILLCDDGRVKIADFGIAKVEGQTELTAEGGLVGTAAYLAPEQVREGPVDRRADLYALGLVMYECLTGTPPFKSDTKAGTAIKRLHADPIDPRRLRAGIPAGMAATIMRALEREPENRFGSAADLRAALLENRPLSHHKETPAAAETGEIPVVVTSFSRSELRWLYPALFLVLISAAVVTVGLLLREPARGLTGHDESSSSSAPELTPTAVVRATPFDPQGDGEENDGSADKAIDGDPSTYWRTEGYEPPGFSGAKTGVGLALGLKGRSVLDSIDLDASTNGWSASIYVVPSADVADFDPAAAHPSGTIESFSAGSTVDLTGVPKADRTGSTVLIWITDLGGAADDGRHRVTIFDVTVKGSLVR